MSTRQAPAGHNPKGELTMIRRKIFLAWVQAFESATAFLSPSPIGRGLGESLSEDSPQNTLGCVSGNVRDLRSDESRPANSQKVRSLGDHRKHRALSSGSVVSLRNLPGCVLGRTIKRFVGFSLRPSPRPSPNGRGRKTIANRRIGGI